jgi:hypothetical protein
MYWLTGIFGLAMAIAPFVLGYSNEPMAMWTSIILGAVVLLASLFEGMDINKAKWEWWVVGVAGILAVIAPFVFGFNTLVMALWTFIALGVVMLLLAGYEVFFVAEPT